MPTGAARLCAAADSQANDIDRAFDYLNRAQREHSTWLAYLGVDPRLDRLRNDPRFAALLHAIGIDRVQAITPATARHSVRH